MKLEPVAENPSPAYPRRSEFLSSDSIPQCRQAEERNSKLSHWGKDLAGATVFFLAFSAGGCDTPSTAGTDAPSGQIVAQAAEKTTKNKTVVAPIFEHGRGQGSTGCVVMTPPSFLSEEEAMKVIKNELARHGVKLGAGGELKDLIVQIPSHNRFGFLDPKSKKQPPLTKPKPLAVDSIDKDKNIFVEYVSKNDCDLFELPHSGWCSASVFNPKKVASDLARSAGKSGQLKRYIGFFYDPITHIKLDYGSETLGKTEKTPVSDDILPKKGDAKKETKGKKIKKRLTHKERVQLSQDESKELLRCQVRDFVKWLDKQGVNMQVNEPKSPSEKKTPPKSP